MASPGLRQRRVGPKTPAQPESNSDSGAESDSEFDSQAVYRAQMWASTWFGVKVALAVFAVCVAVFWHSAEVSNVRVHMLMSAQDSFDYLCVAAPGVGFKRVR